jgi:hypothetical protein
MYSTATPPWLKSVLTVLYGQYEPSVRISQTPNIEGSLNQPLINPISHIIIETRYSKYLDCSVVAVPKIFLAIREIDIMLNKVCSSRDTIGLSELPFLELPGLVD